MKYFSHCVLCCLMLLFCACSSIEKNTEAPEPAMAQKPFKDTDGNNWYKGQLHCHSFWSDGDNFPEVVINEYKLYGFNFVCLTDHNTFNNSTNSWRDLLPNSKQANALERVRRTMGENIIATRPAKIKIKQGENTVEQDGEQYLLSGFDQFAKFADEPNKFLIMPGHEINSSVEGRTLHSNALNIRQTQPFNNQGTVIKTLTAQCDGLKAITEKTQTPNLLMANHPEWPYFDVDPEMLAVVKDLRLYEYCNADSNYDVTNPTYPKMWNRESFFDILTTLRLKNNLPIIYGTGTDDTHHYPEKKDLKPDMKTDAFQAQSWVMVRSKKLTNNAIIEALDKGDFYMSTGVTLDKLTFKNNTLTIKIKPKKGAKYSIKFIGTPKDISIKALTEETVEGKGKVRIARTYDSSIGQTLAVIDGVKASYTLKSTDLYVRAIITSDIPHLPKPFYVPNYRSAWTQPYTIKE